MAIIKTARRIAASALILAALIGLIGAAYLWFSRPYVGAGNISGTTTVNQASPYVPVAPGANAKEGVALEVLPPTAAPGSMVPVAAITNAGSRCVIKVDASIASSDDPALAPQTADDYGTVNWNWRLKTSAPDGTHSLTITCEFHGKSAVVQGSFVVQK